MSKPESDPQHQPPARGLWAEVIHFLKHEKKWWLGPIIAVLGLVLLLIALTRGRGLAPFMYNNF